MRIENEMDWKHYIIELFFAIWEKCTPVDLSDYAFLIQHHFDVPMIESQLIKSISESEVPQIMERYHKIRLRKLIRVFIDTLLNVSDDGKHITNKNIEHAKLMLQQREDCIYSC
ncbi:MAG TPA: hypothetical protein VGM63_14565 [Mucilaginibacter sp.]